MTSPPRAAGRNRSSSPWRSGKITAVNWNGVSNLGVADKKTVAAAGGYGMKKASKLGLEWHEQAANVEAFLVKTQDTGFSKFKDDGTTDAITGASLHVKNFFDLVNEGPRRRARGEGHLREGRLVLRRAGRLRRRAPAGRTPCS